MNELAVEFVELLLAVEEPDSAIDKREEMKLDQWRMVEDDCGPRLPSGKRAASLRFPFTDLASFLPACR